MFSCALAWLEKVLTVGTYTALMMMMLLIAADATVRYLFRETLPDVYHFTELYLMPMVVFFALSNTQRLKGHVAVSLMEHIIPKRLRELILCGVYVMAAACFAIITWRASLPAISDLINWRVTAGVVPWPVGLSRVIVPIGAGILTLRLLADAVICGASSIDDEPAKAVRK